MSINVYQIFLTISLLLITQHYCSCKEIDPYAPAHFEFKGVATGGRLILSDSNYQPESFTVSTQKGESGKEIINRLASVLKTSDPWLVQEQYNEKLVLGKPELTYSFSGSEIGFGMIPPPIALSALFIPSENRLNVGWENQDQYDYILFCVNVESKIIAGDATTATMQIPTFWKTPRIMVRGFKNGISSSIAALQFDKVSNVFKETSGHQGYDGLQPNWTKIGNLNATIVEHSPFLSDHREYDSADDKPFSQEFARSDDNSTAILRRRLSAQSDCTVSKLSFLVNDRLDQAIKSGDIILKVSNQSNREVNFSMYQTGISQRHGSFKKVNLKLDESIKGCCLDFIIPPNNTILNCQIDWLTWER